MGNATSAGPTTLRKDDSIERSFRTDLLISGVSLCGEALEARGLNFAASTPLERVDNDAQCDLKRMII